MAKRGKVVPKRRSRRSTEPQCGLCGSTTNLTKTPCCDNWICDDAGDYVLFSYAHNSCYRNHDRYTLCSHHFREEHEGHWKQCAECKQDIEPEMYVYYGTNEYNFEVLDKIPQYEPTRCVKCRRVIKLGTDGYVMKSDGYYCMNCTDIPFPFA
jgi:hypothetical protein